MPELPEVQTVVDHLAQHVVGLTCTNGEISWPALVHHKEDFLNHLIGKTCIALTRRGKYLVFHLTHGYWIVHLRMEGKFFIQKEHDPIAKHTHAWLMWNEVRLDYNDTRKFGRFDYTEDLEDFFSTRLGLEPFDEQLTADYLKACAKHRRIPVKSFILDQHVLAGVGNIYADESLFSAQLSPFKPVSRVTSLEWDRWIIELRRILRFALESGGSTIRSYSVSHGVSGRFQQSLQVYGRFSQACYRCGTRLDRGRVQGRTTVYCKSCQKVSEYAHRHYRIDRKR